MKHSFFVRREVLTVVSDKVTLFWDVKLSTVHMQRNIDYTP
jgi:hypothetical protein